LQAILSRIWEESFGLAGGALFLLSWILQALESRRANRAIVSLRFFLIRSAGCILLAIEALRSDSYSLFIVTAGTLLLNIYNIRLFLRNSKNAPPDKGHY